MTNIFMKIVISYVLYESEAQKNRSIGVVS
jgi:hypothetical protein